MSRSENDTTWTPLVCFYRLGLHMRKARPLVLGSIRSLPSAKMASVTARRLLLCGLSLLNFLFVFGTGAEFVRFISFRAIYHNITGGPPLCRGMSGGNIQLSAKNMVTAGKKLQSICLLMLMYGFVIKFYL